MREASVQTIDIHGKSAILLASGQIGIENCETLRKKLDQIREDHPVDCLVLDVSLVDYISSAGICMFLNLARELEKQGGKIAFVGMSVWIKRSFDMLGFNRFFDFYESMYAATDALAI